jgi:hypothetical protein
MEDGAGGWPGLLMRGLQLGAAYLEDRREARRSGRISVYPDRRPESHEPAGPDLSVDDILAEIESAMPGLDPDAGLPDLDGLPEGPDFGLRPRRPDSARNTTAALPARAAQPPAAATAPPAAVTASYAAEIDDTSIACLPCTRRHIATMHTAAQAAAASADRAVWRRELAVLAAEAAAWKRYDLTAAKLSRAKPGDRLVILQAERDVDQVLAAIPLAPQHLRDAWGAALESRRFAESASPTARDEQQIAERMSDVEGLIGHLESTARQELGQDNLNLLRGARHGLQHGYAAGPIAACEQALGAVACALTPAPSREQVDRAAELMRQAKRRFFAGVLADLRRRGKPGATRWYKDRDTRLPAELRGFLARGADPGRVQLPTADPADLPAQGLLGATPETVGAALNLLRFDQALGIVDRDRPLPATFEGSILGAYSPELRAAVFNPAITSWDSYALNTLVHENAHALLHGPNCLLQRTPSEQYADEYADTIEEREANLTQLLAFTRAGLPLELGDGTTLPAAQWHVDDAALRREVGPLTYARVTWAAGVLLQAMQTGAAAAELAAACPVRASIEEA